ncbi:MAG: hypothetical protein P9L92_20395 [Candidatus Electryonea clarkiae]|nr:hypothetical protein [Candidatus Electryonea clarkiae]MDP8288002.1 hypothetical protein [Candidatus Electryonea clarkiae]
MPLIIKNRIHVFKYFLAVLFISQICIASLHAGQWQPIKPLEGGKRSVLLIDDKEWTYWKLKPGESMTFDISDDSEYRIITRADLGKKKRKEAIYAFRLNLESEKDKLFSRATKYAKGVSLRNKKNLYIGESRIIEIDKQPEDQTLDIRLGKKAKYPVYFRVQNLREVYRLDADYVAITPSSYIDALGITTNEVPSTYYKMDSGKRLTVEVNGPTTMKVLARVLLNDSMRGKIKFALAVFEDGNLKNTYSLLSSASKVTEVLDRPGVVPSRGENVYIEVPSGRHRYNFDLPDNGREVILRFFIPKKDLGREAK